MQDTSSRVLSFPQRPQPCDEALLGPSPVMAGLWTQIHRVAPHFRAALIAGEAGCGAENAARALHALSPVSLLPFITVDSANADRTIASSLADSGLLFVPEPERLPLSTQRLLVRRLRHRARPLRLVAVLSHDLRACVAAGHIHAELADALSAIRITLPSLRDRAADLPLLASQIATRTAARKQLPLPTLTDSFHAAAASFAWPGNLPQMLLALDHLVSPDFPQELTAQHLDQAIEAIGEIPVPTLPPAPRMVKLDQVVHEHIRSVLIGCHGNKLRAAEVLGISRSTLYRMLEMQTASAGSFSMAI